MTTRSNKGGAPRGRRKRTSQRPAAKRPSAASAAAPRRVSGRARAAAIALGATAVLAVAALLLFGWSFLGGPGAGTVQRFSVQSGESTGSVAARLAQAQLISSPRLFVTYARVFRPSLQLSAGSHVVRGDLSARELLRRLGRLPGRGSVRVLVPEGFNHAQLAERLERQGVCNAEDFRRAALDPTLAKTLGVPGLSVEGYLFPATYELLADSTPSAVVSVLVTEAKKRLALLRTELAAGFNDRLQQHGLTEHGVVTLASMVEKEAARADEKPLIASVFLNRLRDANFRPLRMLQSDPTASFGCLVQQPPPASCSDGPPTPAMLRDATNPYNTYRHPGLPPGPVSSPGEGALRAVLLPATSDYLYFVARGQGRHHFSRTFSEHRGAIEHRR